MQTTFGALVVNAARTFGNKTAMVFDSKTWSYNDVDCMSTQLAVQLKRMGVRFGDVVSLDSPNCPEWIIRDETPNHQCDWMYTEYRGNVVQLLDGRSVQAPLERTDMGSTADGAKFILSPALLHT